jgi:hypothetical protein
MISHRLNAKKRSKSVYLAFVLSFPTKRDDLTGANGLQSKKRSKSVYLAFVLNFPTQRDNRIRDSRNASTK